MLNIQCISGDNEYIPNIFHIYADKILGNCNYNKTTWLALIETVYHNFS
jgi:hypothetical protein